MQVHVCLSVNTFAIVCVLQFQSAFLFFLLFFFVAFFAAHLKMCLKRKWLFIDVHAMTISLLNKPSHHPFANGGMVITYGLHFTAKIFLSTQMHFDCNGTFNGHDIVEKCHWNIIRYRCKVTTALKSNDMWFEHPKRLLTTL